jgi:hypothetical protein
MTRSVTSLPLALALAAFLSAAPALEAQGNGNGRGQQQRELREDRRDRDEPRFERRDDRRQDDRRQDARRSGRQVPPGWCIGRGNPHNTPANCGYRNARTGRYERHDTRYERRGGLSYDEAHRRFHREHDAWCAARRNERPLDIRWQAQVRRECAEAHQRFHREWGIAHR